MKFDEEAKRKILFIIEEILEEDHEFVPRIIDAVTVGVQRRNDKLAALNNANSIIGYAIAFYFNERKTKSKKDYVLGLIDRYRQELLTKHNLPLNIEIETFVEKIKGE